MKDASAGKIETKSDIYLQDTPRTEIRAEKTRDSEDQPSSRSSEAERITGITGTVINSIWSGATEARSKVGYQRTNSVPEPLSTTSYLDTSDYGICISGRTAADEEAVLTLEMISKIHAALPPRFRLCTSWILLYGTTEHGFSLSTLFTQNKYHNGPTLTVIRDDGDTIFGIFSTEPWKPHFGHYGTGECFLWRVEQDRRIKKYGSTGKNSYYLISETSYIAAGCGEGKFGFWVDAELLNGLSQPVPTFDNDCLASAERFKCVNIEVWGLDMSPLE